MSSDEWWIIIVVMMTYNQTQDISITNTILKNKYIYIVWYTDSYHV